MSETGKDTVQKILDQQELRHAEDGPTIQEVYDSMNDDQKALVDYFVSLALDENTPAPS
jgi:hypothetical protein